MNEPLLRTPQEQLPKQVQQSILGRLHLAFRDSDHCNLYMGETPCVSVLDDSGTRLEIFWRGISVATYSSEGLYGEHVACFFARLASAMTKACSEKEPSGE